MKYLIVFSFCFLLFYSVDASPNSINSVTSLTLDEAIDIGVENSFNIISRKNSLERQKLLTESISGKFKPDINLILKTTNRKIESDVSDSSLDSQHYDDSGSSAAVVVTLPWGHKNSIKYDKKISKLSESLEELQLDVEVRKLKSDIYIAYYYAVLFRERLNIEKSFVDTSKERFENAKKDFSLGRKSNWDVLNEESNYLTKLANWHESKVELSNKLSNLASLIGVSLISENALADDIQFDNISWLDSVRFGEISAEDLEEMLLVNQLNKKKLELKKENNTHWKPSLSLTAGYYESNYDTGIKTNQKIVGLSVNIPFPAFSASRKERKLISKDIENISFDIHRYKQEKLNEIAAKRHEVSLLIDQIDTLKLLVDKKSEELDAAIGSYKIGRLTSLDLQNIESMHIDLQKRYFQTLFNLRSSYVSLCWVLGFSV